MASWDRSVAQTIIDVGRQRGFSQREIVAALSTGLVESGLQNINYGDRDSVGVFQQRPSQGWGSVSQIMDLNYSAGKFYDAIAQFDKAGISGGELAARIQRPAAQYRGRYEERWGEAESIYQQLAGGGGNVPLQEGQAPPQETSDLWTTILSSLADRVAGGAREPLGELSMGAGVSPMSTGQVDPLGQVNESVARWGPQPIPGEDMPDPMAMPGQQAGMQTGIGAQGLPDLGDVTPGKNGVPNGLKTNAARGAAAVRKLFGFTGDIGGLGQRKNKSDHPHGNAIDVMTGDNMDLGRNISNWFVQNRDALGLKYVIFNRTIWSARNDWQPRRMEDRGSPTANHVDHPHISFT